MSRSYCSRASLPGNSRKAAFRTIPQRPVWIGGAGGEGELGEFVQGRRCTRQSWVAGPVATSSRVYLRVHETNLKERHCALDDFHTRTSTVDYLIMHMVGLAAKLCSFAVMQD